MDARTQLQHAGRCGHSPHHAALFLWEDSIVWSSQNGNAPGRTRRAREEMKHERRLGNAGMRHAAGGTRLPKPGILFRDIIPLLTLSGLLPRVVFWPAEQCTERRADWIACTRAAAPGRRAARRARQLAAGADPQAGQAAVPHHPPGLRPGIRLGRAGGPCRRVRPMATGWC